MGFFSKIKKKIRKAIPKEAAPFLPALASIFGGPMIASMFGVGGTGMLGQGIGAFLADAGTQELTSDRTRLESSLMSGIFGAARGMTPDASLMTDGPKGRALTGPQQSGNVAKFAPAEKILKSGDAYKAAFKELGTGQKMMEGARSFAMAPLDNPLSIGSASTIGVQAAPKLGYNEVERLSRDLASQAAASAKARGLSYDESMEFANQYFYGSNPGATEAEYNAFMEYYNSDLQERLNVANGGRIGFADGSQNYSNMIPEDYAGDVYGDRDRDSLNMTEFYKEYPETQVGTYINENRYSSEKIEKLETKLNEIIDMRKRTADRSRDSENDGEISLMEKLLDKEINSLYADRTMEDVRKSERQKRDEMNARFAAEAEQKAQMFQDYYSDLGRYVRPGRAMGGMINRPNFNYGGGVQPQQQPSATNLAGMGPLAGLGGILGGGMDSNMRMPTTPGYGGGNSNQSGMVGNIMNAVKTGLDGATQDIQSNVSSQFKPQEVLVPANNNGGGNFQPSVTGGTLQELLGTNMGIMGGGPFSQLQSMSNGGRIGYANGGMPDRPNFNYGSGRQTPQGDPIAPNMPPGMQMDLRPGGFIELGTEPRADDVPAMVGKDEFVLTDRAVAGIGKALTGRADPRAGARALYDLQSQMETTV